MALVNQAPSVEQDSKLRLRRKSTQPLPLISLLVGCLATVGIMLSIWLIFIYAPVDAVQGLPQKIIYFHVPLAFIGMLSFLVTAAAGIAYLVRPADRWDWIARASAEVGTIFLTLALISGSIWAKTIWGTWWTWDAQLTASLILWFIFIAYLMLLSYMGRTESAARSAAVLAIVGAVDVPIIYEATNWWRTLHPTHQLGTPGALPPEVILTLMISLASFTLLYAFFLLQIYQLQRLQTLAQRLRLVLE